MYTFCLELKKANNLNDDVKEESYLLGHAY